MRRVILLLLMAVLLIALPAVATTTTTVPDEAPVEEVDEGAEEPVGDAVGAAAVLAFIHLLGSPLVKVVDRIKKWFNLTRGDVITAIAVAVGTGIAWVFALDPFPAVSSLVPEGFALRDFPPIIGYIVAGVWMAMRAGYLSDQQEAQEAATEVAGGPVPLHGSESHMDAV